MATRQLVDSTASAIHPLDVAIHHCTLRTFPLHFSSGRRGRFTVDID
jgi:hypothetical protein